MHRRQVLLVAVAAALLGGSNLLAERQQEPNCPNWGGGSGCSSSEGALEFCRGYYLGAYPGCTVTSAHCSSLGNYNCFTQQ